MTKAQELDVLREAIVTLGPDSYLGPWLQSVLGSVEHDIRSDIFPTITIADARKLCADELAKASDNAKAIIEVAKADAKKLTDRAEKSVDYATSALRDALRRLSD